MLKNILVFCICLIIEIGFIPAATVQSPGGILSLQVDVTPSGIIYYNVQRSGIPVIADSRLGFVLKNMPALDSAFIITGTEIRSVDETWKPVWGEVSTIRNHYNELTIQLEQLKTKIRINIEFRLFDDGLGFRYVFPAQDGLHYFVVEEECTQFTMTGDHKTFWIPGDFDTNEYTYTESKLSEIDALTSSAANPEIATRSPIGANAVQTPLMMKTDNGLYINIHEAALVNYPAMALTLNKSDLTFRSTLAPDALGNKAYLQTPCKTPWRTVIVSDKAADILASKIILNLNEPCAIENTAWIKPMKFVGVWWEMHVGTATWNYADTKNIDLATTDWSALTPNGKHGANTKRVKEYIDFAAANGIDGVLVEGWNVGWEDWFGNQKENVFDFVTPYPDFDVDALQNYAAAKNVQLIMHHETSASVTNYERRLQDAIDFMQTHNYHAVKTGYVGRIIPRGELHDGQWMVNHYIYVAQQMAKNHIMVDAHEPVRPTGLQRTYPNWLACEAARGNEFNAWSRGNPPAHETILPFTRLIGGPMDYTPGIFQTKMSVYDPGRTNYQVHTTLCKQLALYVTMYSPLQMAADLPENYLQHMDAFQFIKDVAVDWDDTKYIAAEPGDMLTVARKAKGTDNWFIGSITDENARIADIPMDFLDMGKSYLATIYADGQNADWKKNPGEYTIQNFIVTSGTELKIMLAPGGGCAISVRPAEEGELQRYDKFK